MQRRKRAEKRARLLVLAALPLVATVITTGVVAQDAQPTDLQTIDLGGDASVTLSPTRCHFGTDLLNCRVWHPSGFEFGEWQTVLESSYAFARVPWTGRIVAVFRNAGSVDGRSGTPSGVLYTDDLGATWQAGPWRWAQAARALAFDPASNFGIAAGDGGHVWSTEDGGETWRTRRSAAGIAYTQVAVIGRVCVLVDENGTIWRSRDGGFSLDTLTRSRDITLFTADDEIIVTTPEQTLRVRADGSVRRSE